MSGDDMLRPSTMSEGRELRAGTALGPYTIVRRIAIGGMGTIYEAEHGALHKRVALKTPHHELGCTEEGRARFLREARTAAKLRHPHVVDITDVCTVDDVAFMVMEYLEGESLMSRIAREGPLDAQVIGDIFVPVVAALHDAHLMGIIHRDLKPDNIFLTRSVHGNIHSKLLDFGISRVLDDDANLTSAASGMLGTPNYMSPEQLDDPHATTAKSDQYSLGVVLHESATGENPFSSHDSLMSVLRAVEHGEYPRPRDLNALVDARLECIALRAMSHAPAARFASMLELGAQLLSLASPDTRNGWRLYFSRGDGVQHPSTALTSAVEYSWRVPTPWVALAAIVGVAGAAATKWVTSTFPEGGRLDAMASGARSPDAAPAAKSTSPARTAADAGVTSVPSPRPELRGRPRQPASHGEPRGSSTKRGALDPNPRRASTSPARARPVAPAFPSASSDALPVQQPASLTTDNLDPWSL